MIRLILRPSAEEDIYSTRDWYEAEEPGLGARFVAELGNSLRRIQALPLQFPDVGRGVRRALLRRFPYAVYFILPDERRAVVLAVLHQRRHPGAWKKRLPGA
jgi:plasmid stabilization system protein ParE